MSYLVDTALNNYQSKLAQTEIKKPINGAIKFVQDQTADAQVDMETVNAIKNANGRTVDISAIKESSLSVATSFSYNLNESRNDTAKTSVTIYQYWVSFFANKYDFSNNAIAFQQYLDNKIVEADKALANAVSTQLISVLNTNRTQTLVHTGIPSGLDFNETSDAVTIALAKHGAPFFDYLQTLFMQNQIGDRDAVVLASPSLGYIIANHRLYGQYNDKNLMGQAFPQIYTDTNLSATASSDATFYMARKGAAAMFESIPVEFANADNSVADVKFSVGAQAMPLCGMKPLVLEIDSVYDNNGLTTRPTDRMTVTKKFGIGLSFGVVTSYNSDLTTKVNDIVKVEALSS